MRIHTRLSLQSQGTVTHPALGADFGSPVTWHVSSGEQRVGPSEEGIVGQALREFGALFTLVVLFWVFQCQSVAPRTENSLNMFANSS